MKLLITVVYDVLLPWGFSVGVRQIYQARQAPDQLLNPLFRNPVAITLFTLHIVVVSLDLFVIGPLAVEHKSTLWYWGGRIALLSSSLPIAAFFNRNPQSFGSLIGKWVVFRNFFEYGLHVVIAAMAVNWSHYYLLLWWIVAYRYIDVGPRRALQKLYTTPEKLAARPWAPLLNWAVIATHVRADVRRGREPPDPLPNVPGDDVATYVPERWEFGVVIGVNLALALVTWILSAKWVQSLQPAAAHEPEHA